MCTFPPPLSGDIQAAATLRFHRPELAFEALTRLTRPDPRFGMKTVPKYRLFIYYTGPLWFCKGRKPGFIAAYGGFGGG